MDGVTLNLPSESLAPIKQELTRLITDVFKQIAKREALPYWMKKQEAQIYMNVSDKTLDKFIVDGLKVSIIDGTQRISKKSADKYYEDHEL
ncbi:DNA-binding protein [Lactiplantibacillus plantarum]|nr:DNA-binding protein [Lactiplantibacillus plantarum]MCG0744208.1 DNA-binding protein [Lactiplantibacillus plantarum]